MQSERVRVTSISSSRVRVKESNQGFVRNGHSPYIDETTGTWFVFDDTTQSYKDTGVKAEFVIDGTLSDASENPVQNKVVTKELQTKLAEQSIKQILPIDIDVLWENT